MGQYFNGSALFPFALVSLSAMESSPLFDAADY